MRLTKLATVLALMVLAGCQKIAKPPSTPEALQIVRAALGIPTNMNVYSGSYSLSIGTLLCSNVVTDNPPVDPKTCVLGDTNGWFSPNVSPADRTKILKDVVNQIPGGKFSASATLTKDFSANASLPLIGNIFTASANFDVGSTSKVTMSGDSSVQEVIYWDPLRAAKQNHQLSSTFEAHLLNQDCVLVFTDWVVTNLSVTVEYDPSISGSAKASLDNAILSLGKGSQAGITAKKTGTGTITITAPTLIVASAMEPPPNSVLKSAGPATTQGGKGVLVKNPSALQQISQYEAQK